MGISWVDGLFKLPQHEFCAALYKAVKNGTVNPDAFIDIVERISHNNYVDGYNRGVGDRAAEDWGR